MKNIHVLPTDKPSRLSILNNGKLNFGAEFISSSNTKAKHIYITNLEEIKVGDWYYNSFLNEISKMDILDYSNFRQKIILTTDQDLIKDGVQAIDDDFLEWFVKNPSCDEVEVKKAFADGSTFGYGYIENLIYKIIIQKEEEPKKGSMSEAIKQVVSNQLKQETPKEIAERYYEDEVSINGFINGYKLAQEEFKNK